MNLKILENMFAGGLKLVWLVMCPADAYAAHTTVLLVLSLPIHWIHNPNMYMFPVSYGLFVSFTSSLRVFFVS